MSAWLAFWMLPLQMAHPGDGPGVYDELLDYISREVRTDPLLPFSTERDFDRRLNRQNIAFIENNAGLKEDLRAQLPGGPLHWELSRATKRLLVVPESRYGYADLFERYCRDAVAFVLQRLELPNPYRRILTPSEMPIPEAAPGEGVTAYLVHNVADDYVEEYLFYTPQAETGRVMIRLGNREFSGRIGTYSSHLVIGRDRRIDFVRDAFTIWRNSARNPLNVFIAPVEETLHIALREATENAIVCHLEQLDSPDREAVEAVVHDWMAVEEAVVGGLAFRLLPEMFGNLIPAQMSGRLAEALDARKEFARYQYLAEGIRIVARLGMSDTIRHYQTDLIRFSGGIRQVGLKAALSTPILHPM